MVDDQTPEEVRGRWRSDVVLKRDVFSTVERGRFRTDAGDVDAVLRRLDQVPWWSRCLATVLFRRKRRALAIAGTPGVRRRYFSPAGGSWYAAGLMASRSISPSLMVTLPISVLPRRRCACCTTP